MDVIECEATEHHCCLHQHHCCCYCISDCCSVALPFLAEYHAVDDMNNNAMTVVEDENEYQVLYYPSTLWNAAAHLL